MGLAMARSWGIVEAKGSTSERRRLDSVRGVQEEEVLAPASDSSMTAHGRSSPPGPAISIPLGRACTPPAAARTARVGTPPRRGEKGVRGRVPALLPAPADRYRRAFATPDLDGGRSVRTDGRDRPCMHGLPFEGLRVCGPAWGAIDTKKGNQGKWRRRWDRSPGLPVAGRLRSRSGRPFGSQVGS